jgi:hypothetical protein
LTGQPSAHYCRAVPSLKASVICYVSLEVDAALRLEASRLTAIAADMRERGYAGRFGIPNGAVSPGQVAVHQLQQVLGTAAAWRPVDFPLPDGARPVRQRWLAGDDLRRRVLAFATMWDISASDVVARIVQPTPEAWQGIIDWGPGKLQDGFLRPLWVSKAAAAMRRKSRVQAARHRRVVTPSWPWDLPGVSSAEAKTAWRAFIHEHHPDKGGDPEHFRRGKEHWESWARTTPVGSRGRGTTTA